MVRTEQTTVYNPMRALAQCRLISFLSCCLPGVVIIDLVKSAGASKRSAGVCSEGECGTGEWAGTDVSGGDRKKACLFEKLVSGKRTLCFELHDGVLSLSKKVVDLFFGEPDISLKAGKEVSAFRRISGSEAVGYVFGRFLSRRLNKAAL